MACACMRHLSAIRTPTVASAGPPKETANSRVLILGGTGRVGGSTAIALSKLSPDLRITIAGRNRFCFHFQLTIPNYLLILLFQFNSPKQSTFIAISTASRITQFLLVLFVVESIEEKIQSNQLAVSSYLPLIIIA